MTEVTVAAVEWLQTTFGEAGRPLFDIFSTWGGPVGWELVVPLAFWLGGSRLGLRVGFATLVAAAGNLVLKWSFAQPRPYYLGDGVEALKSSDGFGMPSGHAQGAAAQWGALAYHLRRSWWWLSAGIIIALTGTARVYYGLHSPAQVVVGWGLGLLVVVAVVKAEKPVVRWCRGRSATIQTSAAVVSAAVALSLALAVSLGLRGDFSPPPEWSARWQATVERLGEETRDLDEGFHLVEPAEAVTLSAYLLGMALCGLWVLRNGEVRPESSLQRLANVAIGLPLLAGLLAVGALPESFVGEIAATVSVRLVLPTLAGIVVPKVTSRLLVRSGRF